MTQAIIALNSRLFRLIIMFTITNSLAALFAGRSFLSSCDRKGERGALFDKAFRL
jgi:hypothetical protein